MPLSDYNDPMKCLGICALSRQSSKNRACKFILGRAKTLGRDCTCTKVVVRDIEFHLYLTHMQDTEKLILASPVVTRFYSRVSCFPRCMHTHRRTHSPLTIIQYSRTILLISSQAISPSDSSVVSQNITTSNSCLLHNVRTIILHQCDWPLTQLVIYIIFVYHICRDIKGSVILIGIKVVI